MTVGGGAAVTRFLYYLSPFLLAVADDVPAPGCLTLLPQQCCPAAKSVAPSLLLLDEVDAAAPSPTLGGSSDAQRQLAAALLAAVDALRASGARCVLLAASSRRVAVVTGGWPAGYRQRLGWVAAQQACLPGSQASAAAGYAACCTCSCFHLVPPARWCAGPLPLQLARRLRCPKQLLTRHPYLWTPAPHPNPAP